MRSGRYIIYANLMQKMVKILAKNIVWAPNFTKNDTLGREPHFSVFAGNQHVVTRDGHPLIFPFLSCRASYSTYFTEFNFHRDLTNMTSRRLETKHKKLPYNNKDIYQ